MMGQGENMMGEGEDMMGQGDKGRYGNNGGVRQGL